MLMVMKKITGLIGALLLSSAGLAFGQAGPMDACQTVSACDGAAGPLIEEARRAATTGRYREAAQILYPVVLNQLISPLTKAEAANTFSDILARADLFVHAAGQKANANGTTRAPASEDLLAYARLLARTDQEEETIAAYQAAEQLAIAAANLQTLDGIISDYFTMGNRQRANALRAQLPEIKARGDAACGQVNCRSARLVDAKILELGPLRYPRDARRKTGDCQVTLNITEDGRPVDLVPDCTDPVFIEAAMIAVQQSEFSVRYENGVPQPRYNIIMPFAFAPG